MNHVRAVSQYSGPATGWTTLEPWFDITQGFSFVTSTRIWTGAQQSYI